MKVRLGLKETMDLLRQQAKQLAEPLHLDESKTKLTSVISTLDFSRPTAPLKPKPDVLKKWTSAQAANWFDSITNSDLRHLFWIKTVALQPKFLDLIRNRKMAIGRSSLKGFAYSITSEWKNVVEGRISVQSLGKLMRTMSQSPFLKVIEPYIFEPGGHSKFAYEFIKRKKPISNVFSDIIGITFSANEYVDEVLGIVIDVGCNVAISNNAEEREWFYHHVLSLLDKSRLRHALERIVPIIKADNREENRERLKEFILSHPNLGDPRLPGFESNWDQNAASTHQIIEWLSQSDIKFFFDLFIENKSDVQGRKQFWLKYAHLVTGTRVIVSESDQRRLVKQLADLSAKNKYSKLIAELRENAERSTAFMMDFGKVKVVEFSLSGHACYFYGNTSAFKFNDRSKFWSTERFSKHELKDQDICTERISHQEGWEEKFSQTLAKFGVRPKNRVGRTD